ncbi:MAG: DoxX family protein [Candidatus Sungbacteria bacterium]|nr:DoxX family protein [Candidatus Sungbacteria bacterium]
MFESLLNPLLAHFLLRVVLGALFVAHGYPKLFKNFSGVAGWFDSIGLKPGKFWALVVGAVEFFGGLLLILGVWVQLVGILLAVVMSVAMWKAKWGKVGLTDQGGWELDLIYLTAALSLVFTGGGMYSLL